MRDAIDEVDCTLRMKSSMVEILQTATEALAVAYFERFNLAALHAKRIPSARDADRRPSGGSSAKTSI